MNTQPFKNLLFSKQPQSRKEAWIFLTLLWFLGFLLAFQTVSSVLSSLVVASGFSGNMQVNSQEILNLLSWAFQPPNIPLSLILYLGAIFFVRRLYISPGTWKGAVLGGLGVSCLIQVLVTGLGVAANLLVFSSLSEGMGNWSLVLPGILLIGAMAVWGLGIIVFGMRRLPPGEDKETDPSLDFAHKVARWSFFLWLGGMIYGFSHLWVIKTFGNALFWAPWGAGGITLGFSIGILMTYYKRIKVLGRSGLWLFLPLGLFFVGMGSLVLAQLLFWPQWARQAAAWISNYGFLGNLVFFTWLVLGSKKVKEEPENFDTPTGTH